MDPCQPLWYVVQIFSCRTYGKRIFFPEKEIYVNWLNWAFQLAPWFLFTLHLNLVSFLSKCRPVFPWHLTHFIFPLIAEAVTLCTLCWLKLSLRRRALDTSRSEWLTADLSAFGVKALRSHRCEARPVVHREYPLDSHQQSSSSLPFDSHMLIQENVVCFDKVGRIIFFSL